MIKLSVSIATFNEEKNIKNCLDSVKDLAEEIIIVDGSSTDKTVQIARELGAKVTITTNPRIFHINKQKAMDQAKGEWILQLDADETVTPELAHEIIKVINMSDREIVEYQGSLSDKELFLRHQELIEERDGKVGETEGEYAAFFIPRLNYFLGKYLQYGGVYPDGVIRLIKNGYAYLPCKDVHEQMVVKGKVGWFQNSLLHKDSPNFKRYLEKNSRYIDLIALEYQKDKVHKNIRNAVNYFIVKPIWWFFLTQIRHKGFMDGFQGVTFSFFSALRFPRAYFRYLRRGS